MDLREAFGPLLGSWTGVERLGRDASARAWWEHRLWRDGDRLGRAAPGFDGTYQRISGH